MQERRLKAENRKKWLKMLYQAYFGPPVLRGKNFLSLAAEWDLLGIWSGRKYVRTKEIVPDHPQENINFPHFTP